MAAAASRTASAMLASSLSAGMTKEMVGLMADPSPRRSRGAHRAAAAAPRLRLGEGSAIKPTISFVIPALNEEANIADAVREAAAAMGDRFRDYELLLFDDGSTDRTGAIMDDLAAADPAHVRVTHNPTSRNLGGVYKQGIALARMDYILMVPGDNENPGHALQAPFDAIGGADIVLPYPVNSAVRGFARNTVSRIYVGLLNRLFGLRVR